MTPDNTRRLIENLSFSLARNDNLVVVGRSGVGKSSLLRAIAGLDEATSALDRENEVHLYGTLKALGIHYISVGHRSTLLDYHDCVLELQGGDRWQILPVREYRDAVAAPST